MNKIDKLRNLKKDLTILALSTSLSMSLAGCKDMLRKDIPISTTATETETEPETKVIETTEKKLTTIEKGEMYINELLSKYNSNGHRFTVDDVKVSRYRSSDKPIAAYTNGTNYIFNYHQGNDQDPLYDPNYSFINADDVISVKVNYGDEEPYYVSIAALVYIDKEDIHNIYMVCRDENGNDHHSATDSLILDENSETFDKLVCISYWYKDKVNNKDKEKNKTYNVK